MYNVDRKTLTFWSVDNLATVSGERHVVRQKFWNFVQKEVLHANWAEIF